MIDIPINKDIVRYILSQYLNYKTILGLKDFVSNLQLFPLHYKIIKEISHIINDVRQLVRINIETTYIDEKISKILKYYGGRIISEYNYDDVGLLHGWRRRYYLDAKLEHETLYRHGQPIKNK
jgi:hypothetical protein